MVYKPKTAYKRKRTYKRKFIRKSKIARSVNVKKDLHYFSRWSLTTDVAGNVAYAPYQNSFTYTLGGLPSVTDFSNLFDRYMITFVKHYFTLVIDPSAQTASTAQIPQMYYVRDYDDSTLLSVSQMREHNKAKRVNLIGGKTIGIGIRPSILNEIYRSAVTTSYEPKWRTWVDMAAIDVPHYGLKIVIDNLTNTNYILKHEVKMWFACKDTR